MNNLPVLACRNGPGTDPLPDMRGDVFDENEAEAEAMGLLLCLLLVDKDAVPGLELTVTSRLAAVAVSGLALEPLTDSLRCSATAASDDWPD